MVFDFVLFVRSQLPLDVRPRGKVGASSVIRLGDFLF